MIVEETNYRFQKEYNLPDEECYISIDKINAS